MKTKSQPERFVEACKKLGFDTDRIGMNDKSIYDKLSEDKRPTIYFATDNRIFTRQKER